MTYIAKLSELKNVAVSENNEPFVLLNMCEPVILCNKENLDMSAYTGDKVWVRRSIREKLLQVQSLLGDKTLFIYYGYRHPEVQEKYWREICARYKNLPEDKLHEFIAHPTVAGHPTGGAVDVTMMYQGEEVDMGGKIMDFSDPEKIPTYSKNITEIQQKNRLLLHDAMKKAGFAPFYGEWWHFSFGDREWAAFYGKPQALYDSRVIE